MTFEKLVQFFTEARDENPGRRFHTAKNAVGPAGIVSGPIGKSDNFELRTPIKKWDFNMDNVGNEVDYKDKSGEDWILKSRTKSAGGLLKDKRNILHNAFGLLKNDPTFEDSVMAISSEFDKNRENYRHYILGEKPGGRMMLKYDEESKLESVANALQKSSGRISTLMKIAADFRDKLRVTELSTADIINLNRDVALGQLEIDRLAPRTKDPLYKSYSDMSDELDVIDKKIQDVKDDILNTKSETKIAKLKITLDRLRTDRKEITNELSKTKYEKIIRLYNNFQKISNEVYSKSEMLKSFAAIQPSDMEHKKKRLEEALDKLEKEKLNWKKLAEEGDNLNERVSQIGKVNFENNQSAIKAFLKDVVDSAEKTKKILQRKAPLKDFQSIDVDWEKKAETIYEKSSMLDTLAVLDHNNPIIGYLDVLYRRAYAIPETEGDIFDPNTNTFRVSSVTDEVPLVSLKELRPEEFNKNTNITSIRDFNSLPFVRLLNSFVNSQGTITLDMVDTDVDHTQFINAWNDIYGKLSNHQFRTTSDPAHVQALKSYWENEKVKNVLRTAVLALGLPESKTKNILYMIARPWSVSKSGANSYKQLLGVLLSETKKLRGELNLNVGAESIAESFDQMYVKIMKKANYDKDLMKIGLMEILK